MDYDVEKLQEAHAHTKDNEIEILSSQECGCIFCRSHFSARAVNDWDDSNMHTQALCPECGMPSLIGDASGFPVTDKEFLKQMNLAFFGPDYISKHPEAARIYLDRYYAKKITHNPKNEKLAVSYLKTLVDNGDEKAILTLASFYAEGGEFGKKNTAKALELLSSPVLKTHPDALCDYGTLLLGEAEASEKYWRAFEAFSKATALGSQNGAFFLAQCYLFGIYCDKDPEFGLNLLHNHFGDVYLDFIEDSNLSLTFMNYTYRIGLCYADGIGTEINEERAIRYLLMAHYAYQVGTKDYPNPELDAMNEEAVNRINQIARAKDFHKGEAVFDQYTFYDSLVDISDGMVPITLVHASYDPNTHDLDLELELSSPLIYVDLGSLSCGIVEGRTHWHFTDINGFSGKEGAVFNRIFTPEDGVWAFTSSQNNDPVMVISFDRNGDEDGE